MLVFVVFRYLLIYYLIIVSFLMFPFFAVSVFVFLIWEFCCLDHQCLFSVFDRYNLLIILVCIYIRKISFLCLYKDVGCLILLNFARS